MKTIQFIQHITSISSRLLTTLWALAILSAPTSGTAQAKSAKRGIGWDEKSQKLTDAPINKMLPGISWIYNWGASPSGNASNLGTDDGMAFVPMCWNGSFNETTIRNYIKQHKSTRYLLGFNEPNFSAQANMIPKTAAAKWQKLEQIARDYNLKLVAPALNFTGEKVGGKVWQPYDWLDAFIKEYKSQYGKLPQMDCLALHCYMNWYGANTWFATEYFYKDLYDSKNENYGKYPNIVEFLDTFYQENGHFPKMMLTEFCSWENDGTIKDADFQINQMTQKVQKLEQSDLVEGYAWFMANGKSSEYPYNSLLKINSVNSDLSDLGKIYVYMSSFDTEKYYAPNEQILAKDYIDATTDNQQAKLRPNTESGSEVPLQVEMQRGTRTKYQIEVPSAGEYIFTVHIKSSAKTKINFYIDGKNSAAHELEQTNGTWNDRTFSITLPEGKHDIALHNTSTSFLINSFCFTSSPTGIGNVNTAPTDTNTDIYNLAGQRAGKAKSQIVIINGKKIVRKR